jgi:predicted GH43/DUF377 family glycosyl hydrolase
VTDSLRAVDSSIVLRHGDIGFGDQYGARDPWVFEFEGRYFMHYDAAGESGWLAALATSNDGRVWTKHGPIFELGEPGAPDAASASYATTFYDDERWHAFYLGTPNATADQLKVPAFPYMTLKARAPSPIGPWTKQVGFVPFAPAESSWYADTASPGAIVKLANEYLMIFSGSARDSSNRIWRTLGVARTGDLDAPWTIDPDPLFPITEQVENSSLYFQDKTSTWFLFTNHVGEATDREPVAPQATSEYTDAVWVYWAPDLASFSPSRRAVVLDADNVGWSPRIVGLPSVLEIDGRLAIFFDGSQDDDIGHGYRDIGVAWLDLPIRTDEIVVG